MTGAPRCKPLLARMVDHFRAAEAPGDDAAELWGRRIGRGLALIIGVGLVAMLILQWRA